MSMATWKAEFYPEDAKTFGDPNNPRTALEAVDHSILKWEGLQHDKMREHGIRHWNGGLIGRNDEFMYLNSSSCALCVQDPYWCVKCPLAKVRQGVGCSTSYTKVDNFGPSPWTLRQEKPEVMLMWLKKAREYVVQEPITYTPEDE